MRIVQVVSGQGWSGGQQQVLHLAEGLLRRGHEVVVVCRRGSELRRRAAARGLEVAVSPMARPLDPALFRLLRDLTRRWEADVIDAHRPRALGMAAAVKAFEGRPALVATRRVSFRVSRLSARFTYGLLADGVVAVAGGIRDSLADSGVPPAKIKVIRGGVDTARFRPGMDPGPIRRELELAQDVRVVLVAATWSWWKGQARLLRVLPEVSRQTAPLVILLAGHGTDGREPRDLAAAPGIAGRVRGLGFRDDVERLLAAADLLVSPSVAGEGITGAVREAMAAGVPVVATAAGGNAELVRDGETGRLVPAGDDAALAAAMASALNDRDGSLRMAVRARQEIVLHWSVERMVDETEAFYRELLSSGVSPR